MEWEDIGIEVLETAKTEKNENISSMISSGLKTKKKKWEKKRINQTKS